MENELILEIESLSNLGYGISKYDGKVIFVENTCPKDIVKVKITRQSKTYSYAKVLEIIKPSPYRIKPMCPIQKICGSCQLQFIDYKYQLKLKKHIVQNYARNLSDIEVNNVIPSPDNIEYRHKIQYPVSETKKSKRILAGYYKKNTHEIINVKYCPIQPKICDEIIEYIRKEAPKCAVSGYDEKKHSGDLRHVVIRVSNYTKKCLVVLVINSDNISKNIIKLANSVYNEFDNVVGVCINFNTKKTNLILSNKTECVAGQDYIEEKLCDCVFKIGATTFFQINPKSAENIFRYIKDYIKNNFEKPVILDAYAGIAAFGIVLSDVAKNIVSVEENQSSINLAKDIINTNNILNIEVYADDTAKYLEHCQKQFDITILDPPRKGCTQEILEKILKVTKSKIIYVSCNPQTLMRDLEFLRTKGAKFSTIQPFDMFCHTYHVECVTVIDV